MSRKRHTTRPLQDRPLADVERVADWETGDGFDPMSEPAEVMVVPEPEPEPEPPARAELNGPYEAVDSGVHDRHGNRCAIGGFDHNRKQSGPAYARLIADALNAYKP